MGFETGDKPVILLRLAVKMLAYDAMGNSVFSDVRGSVVSITGRSVPIQHYIIRVPDEKTNFMIERKYTPICMGDNCKEVKKNRKKDEDVFSFVISLLSNGKMSNVLHNIKVGQRLLLQGPIHCKRDFLRNIDDGVKKWKTVFIIAAGTGISTMINLVNYYLFQSYEKNVRFHLVWFLKSPKHNYAEIVGLKELEMKSGGYFKWVIYYPSRNTKNENMKLKNSMDTAEHRWDNMIGNGDFWGREYSRAFTLQLLEEVLFYIVKEEQRFFIGKRCLIDIETKDDEHIFDDDDLEYDAEIGKTKQFNRICLVAGSPMFDQNVSKELQNVGFEEKGIITFQFCS